MYIIYVKWISVHRFRGVDSGRQVASYATTRRNSKKGRCCCLIGWCCCDTQNTHTLVGLYLLLTRYFWKNLCITFSPRHIYYTSWYRQDIPNVQLQVETVIVRHRKRYAISICSGTKHICYVMIVLMLEKMEVYLILWARKTSLQRHWFNYLE